MSRGQATPGPSRVSHRYSESPAPYRDRRSPVKREQSPPRVRQVDKLDDRAGFTELMAEMNLSKDGIIV